MMIGHGSPNRWPILPARRFVRWRVAMSLLICCALQICADLSNRSTLTAQEVTLQLRLAWGGGAEKSWHGEISLDQGTLSQLTLLGLEPDEPGSIAIDSGRVVIGAHHPTSYRALNVHVRAKRDAQLTVQLTSIQDPSHVVREQVAIAELIQQPFLRQIDATGNWLHLQRAAGDQIRITMDRDSLVFFPGQQLNLTVEPNHSGISPDTAVDCQLQVAEVGSTKTLWQTDRTLQSDSQGSLPNWGPIAVPIPEQEGVYDLSVSLTPRRSSHVILRSKPAAERRIQFVVIDRAAPASDNLPWEEFESIDPVNPHWWDRLRRLPQLKLIPGFGEGELGNGKSRVVSVGDHQYIELAPRGWQAYPLPIQQVGQPHILEVECLVGEDEKLGISIFESGEIGETTPWGVDSGVYNAAPLSTPEGTSSPVFTRHRVVIWPNTQAPLLILANHSDTRSTRFGKIRVWAGPARLTPAIVRNQLFPNDRMHHERLIGPYYDKPLFPESFSATEAFDAEANRTFDDWTTFLDGGKRLVEYLQYSGFNGTVLTVTCEGSSIYPSQLLQPTPKYDSGMFFSNGQDPVRKDVLEMMFRLFDRAGLRLVPAIEFSSPLPELEAIRRRGGAHAIGIELIGDRGQGAIRMGQSSDSEIPRYNPLDLRVQQAIINVADELIKRYSHHPSFGGLALKCGPDTYVRLPSERWGYDDRTVGRFKHQTKLQMEDQGVHRYDVRRQTLLNDAHRSDWLKWRSQEIAGLYQQILHRLRASNRQSKLYLVGAQMFHSREAVSKLRPSLHRRRVEISEAMLKLGIDLSLLAENQGIVFLKPDTLAPFEPLASRRIDINLRYTHEVERFFQSQGATGNVFYHQTQPTQLSGFAAPSSVHEALQQHLLLPHLSPTAHLNRQRFVRSLASSDSMTMLDGGWMAPLGQEGYLAELVKVFRQLPAEPFETFRFADRSRNTPVVLRTLQQAHESYLYLVNDSPWPVAVEFTITSSRQAWIESLSDRPVNVVGREGDKTIIQVTMQPYDLIGGRLNITDFEVVDLRAAFPHGTDQLLNKRLDQLLAKIRSIPDSPTTLAALSNPDFEQTDSHRPLPGWTFSRGAGISISYDRSQVFHGSGAVRLASEEPIAWMRSQPFLPPETGRLSLSVWLKTDDPAQQPPLRLSIEGRHHNEVYYRFGNVGLTADQRNPLDSEWRRFDVHFDDLPLEGLSNLQVGFDLMGRGKVWIDDVRVYDRWFDDKDKTSLLQSIAVARHQVSSNHLAACQRFLDSYWPRFLNEYSTETAIAAQPVEPVKTASRPDTEAVKPQESRSVIDRVKGLVPRSVFPFR